MLARLAITLSLGAAACLAVAAGASMPDGINAARAVAAADDPVRLSELALDRSFDAAVAKHEIEAALAAGDVELARSFLDLAAERGVAIVPALIEKTQSAERDAVLPARCDTLEWERGRPRRAGGSPRPAGARG